MCPMHTFVNAHHFEFKTTELTIFLILAFNKFCFKVLRKKWNVKVPKYIVVNFDELLWGVRIFCLTYVTGGWNFSAIIVRKPCFWFVFFHLWVHETLRRWRWIYLSESNAVRVRFFVLSHWKLPFIELRYFFEFFHFFFKLLFNRGEAGCYLRFWLHEAFGILV